MAGLVDKLNAETAAETGAGLGRSRVSRRNFDRRFREAVGHSANEEIISVRLAAACELPRGGTQITAIPDLCGAGCYRTLDAMFRTRFGMSMGLWRERHAR